MKPLDRKIVTRIRQLRNLKLSVGLIADRLSISVATVSNYLLPSQRKIAVEYTRRYHKVDPGDRIRYRTRKAEWDGGEVSNIRPAKWPGWLVV